MAQSSLILFFSSLLFFLVLSSVDARPGLHFHPCNTFLVSTYSFSFRPRSPNFPNQPHPHLHHRPEFFAVVTELREFDDPKPDSIFIDRTEILPHNQKLFLNGEGGEIQDPFRHHPVLPFGVSSSLYDRTMDILNVVASLLFGAACGALTAGTMYLIWSLFNNRHHHDTYHNLDGFSSEDGDDDDDDDIFNPKKPAGGYIAVPAGPPAAVEEATPAEETA
ncbi:hypothetical protein Ancab_023909 [Ancistrocladus abbreviatus]